MRANLTEDASSDFSSTAMVQQLYVAWTGAIETFGLRWQRCIVSMANRRRACVSVTQKIGDAKFFGSGVKGLRLL